IRGEPDRGTVGAEGRYAVPEVIAVVEEGNIWRPHAARAGHGLARPLRDSVEYGSLQLPVHQVAGRAPGDETVSLALVSCAEHVVAAFGFDDAGIMHRGEVTGHAFVDRAHGIGPW